MEVEGWAYQEKQEIEKLRVLIRENLVRAAEIVKKAHEDMVLVERVKSG